MTKNTKIRDHIATLSEWVICNKTPLSFHTCNPRTGNRYSLNGENALKCDTTGLFLKTERNVIVWDNAIGLYAVTV